jgi:hypothetical protein
VIAGSAGLRGSPDGITPSSNVQFSASPDEFAPAWNDQNSSKFHIDKTFNGLSPTMSGPVDDLTFWSEKWRPLK